MVSVMDIWLFLLLADLLVPAEGTSAVLCSLSFSGIAFLHFSCFSKLSVATLFGCGDARASLWFLVERVLLIPLDQARGRFEKKSRWSPASAHKLDGPEMSFGLDAQPWTRTHVYVSCDPSLNPHKLYITLKKEQWIQVRKLKCCIKST